MPTESYQQSFEFHPLNAPLALGRFDGRTITTDAGGLLMREGEKQRRFIERFAGCFQDNRAPGEAENAVRELAARGVYGPALDQEDLTCLRFFYQLHGESLPPQ